jgi:hypothetical protein
MHRSSSVLVATIALASLAPSAQAEPVLARTLGAPRASATERKNIAVGRIEGPKSAKIRLALMQRLKDSTAFIVTDIEDLKPNAGKSAIAKMAKALEADAVMLGSVSRGADLTVHIYKPDGRLVEQIKVKGGSTAKLEKAIQNEFDVTIAPPLAEASGAKLSGRGSGSGGRSEPIEEEEEEPEAIDATPEPSAESTEEAPPAEEEESAPAAEDQGGKETATKAGPTPFELIAGVRGYSRSFEYTGIGGIRDPTLRRTIQPYQLAFAPSLLIKGVLYPGAFFTDGFGAHIGIMGGAELGIATTTDYEQKQANGSKLVTSLKTTSQSWDVGLRGRVPLGVAEIGVYVQYGSHSFILTGDEGGAALAPLVPDVRYGFVRIGLEPRVRLGKVLLGGHIAPRILTSLNNIDLRGVWFSNATGSGLEFGLMAGYGLLPFLDLVAGADFIGYGFDFNPIDPDPRVDPLAVGGATDRYQSLWFGVRLALGGKSAE